MTSKEALEELKDHLVKPINASSDFTEWVIEIYDIIKQDLERLELLEIENKVLQEELDDKNKKLGLLTNKNYQLEKENQELKEKADKYDELCSHNVFKSQSFGVDLIEAILNQSKRVNDRNKKLGLENKKLEKAIELLKEIGGLHLVKQVNGNDVYYALLFYGINIELEENEYNDFKEVFEE